MEADLSERAASQLRDLQLVELSILREFIRVCEEHELRYYLAYGTLLGAVRHQGFIPWDDDIDVTMPRSDYNRFADISRSALRPGFRWQSYATDMEFPHLFAKLLKVDTLLRQWPSQHLNFQQSVYIDVFPLDGLAQSSRVALFQRAIVRVCRLRLSSGLKRGLLKRLLVQLTKALPRGLAIAGFEATTQSWPVDRSASWTCAGGPYGHSRQAFPREWFGTGATQTFEGLTVVGPAEAHRYLQQVYGDYMTFPKLSDRQSQHEVTEVRLNIPTPPK
jgi:lipopolysaccharide cholinephosphotransferase